MLAASDYLRFKHAPKLRAAAVKAKALKKELKPLRRGITIDDNATECGDLPSTSLSALFSSFHHSYLLHLRPESEENLAKSLQVKSDLGHENPSRPVHNGHYVRVSPKPLRNPKLVIASEHACQMLGLDAEDVATEEFVKFFSGDLAGALQQYRHVDAETWATPYALSIMGKRYVQDPFGGDGYGDGRAISVGEVLIPHPPEEDSVDTDGPAEDTPPERQYYPAHASRYELQLKGSGPTPFCRGGDGRTVLRSSIREFLASEAMHHLGVGTARALCLVVSEGEKKRVFFGLKKKKNQGDISLRPWYSDTNKTVKTISTNDPRLAGYSEQDKREIVNQYAIRAKAEPDTVLEEKCAVTTRCCSSFIRVGHFDLFARRVEMVKSGGNNGEEADVKNSSLVKETVQYKELEDLMWHACYREYFVEAYDPYWETRDAKAAALALMEGSMNKIAEMVAGWVRVGFVQGNFNADNCLISGKQLDYGPFGFLDVYHPLASKWTAPGDHFGFMNQAKAGFANFTILVESLLPVIEVHGGQVDELRDEMLAKAEKVFAESVNEALRSKMGLEVGPPEVAQQADELWKEIEPLLRMTRADWTLFWRQLTYVAVNFSSINEPDSSHLSERMLTILLGNENTHPFYDVLTAENKLSLKSWLEKWHKSLVVCHKYYLSQPSPKSFPPPCERMHLSNPKYTLREWMLVEAYSKANGSKYTPGDYSLVHELHELSKDPYGEGSSENHQKYYRRAPDEALRACGTAFMS
ncbi:hypothetical protein ACHAWX_003266 [Stephanocyclus meneghinianus]